MLTSPPRNGVLFSVSTIHSQACLYVRYVASLICTCFLSFEQQSSASYHAQFGRTGAGPRRPLESKLLKAAAISHSRGRQRGKQLLIRRHHHNLYPIHRIIPGHLASRVQPDVIGPTEEEAYPQASASDDSASAGRRLPAGIAALRALCGPHRAIFRGAGVSVGGGQEGLRVHCHLRGRATRKAAARTSATTRCTVVREATI